MRRRSTKAAVLAAVAALSLTGCAGLRPGVAAEVGDTTISTDEVDAFAKGLCAYFPTSPQGPQTSARVRNIAVFLLIRSELANGYGRDLGVRVDRGAAEEAVRSIEPAVAKLPEEDRETFLDAVRGSVIGDLYATRAATDALAAKGQEATDEAIGAEQTALYQQWAEKAGVELDPRFGAWEDGAVAAKSGSLSVPADAAAPDDGEAADDEAADTKLCG